MKRFLWALPTFLLVISASAFADSVIIGLNTNDGSGDNFGFIIKSSGLTFGGGGGTPYSSLSKNSFKPESPRSGVQVWQPFFVVIGFVVGGIFPRSIQSLCPHMLDRISACDRQVERAGEPWQ